MQLERGPDGWITGEIAGVPSLREGKVDARGRSGWRRAGWPGTTSRPPSIPIR